MADETEPAEAGKDEPDNTARRKCRWRLSNETITAITGLITAIGGLIWAWHGNGPT